MISFTQLGADIGSLVEAKQMAYGDSFTKSGTVMRALYPHGIDIDQLDDALTVVRIIDKLFRVATDRDAFGESPWRDIVGYGLLAVRRHEGVATGPAAESHVTLPSAEPHVIMKAEIFRDVPDDPDGYATNWKNPWPPEDYRHLEAELAAVNP